MSPPLGPQRLAELIGGGIILTEEQTEVIGAPLASRLVVAGAGAGKTFVMAMRVVYLVANGLVAPEAILGLTFTRKAAAELAGRIRFMLAQLPAAMAGGEDALSPTVSTYDAYASTIVRGYGLLVGADPEARILTQAQRWRVATDVVEGWAGSEDVDAGVGWLVHLLLSLASQTVDNEVGPGDLVAYLDQAISSLSDKPPGINPVTGRVKKVVPGLNSVVKALRGRRAAAGLIERYRERQAELGVMDFADQAAWARRLARGGASSSVTVAEQERFQAVLLDEFQDTSASQVDFLSALFGATPVMAVGDPNQSIYGWRGASATALAAFKDRFWRTGEDSAEELQPTSYLTIARRNDRAVLAVANQVAEPLRGSSSIDLPELRPRAEAGPGQAEAAYFATQNEEAQAIAEYLSQHWAPFLDGPVPRTAAVLVRTRSRLDPITQALEAAGLDYEVIGRGGLLRTPEVQDIVSALTASQDLTRGDAFMRLATSARFAVGVKDLDLLSKLTRPVHDPEDPSPAGGQGPESEERLAILDALEAVAGTSGKTGTTGISSEGMTRLRRIRRVLRRLREAASYLSLPELVLEAEKALGLDLDLMAAGGPSGRAQINQLVNEAHDYATGQDQASLEGFLDWLEAESEISDGLDLAEVPAPGGAVQLLTVHGAKGLEWDVVCVPGLVEAGFPAVKMKVRESSREPYGLGWLSDAHTAGASGGLPWPLRLDRAGLPAFNYEDAADVVELETQLDHFKHQVGRHFLAEERRVAYVAVTRAKSHLYLSGWWYATGTKTSRPPSVFLQELVSAGLVSDSAWAPDPGCAEPEEAAPVVAVWPPADPAGHRQPTLAAAATALGQAGEELGLAHTNGAVAMSDAGPAASCPGRLQLRQAAMLLEEMGSDLASRAALLIREDEREGPPRVTLPDQTSATALIGLAGQDPRAIESLRRPVPSPPSRGAGLGEEFHRRAALELSALSGGRAHQGMLDSSLLFDCHVDSAAEAQLRSLMDKFRRSRWMAGTNSLVAAEAELEIELLGRAVVARIDAIFQDRLGRMVVVDWKTGRSDGGHAKPVHAEQVMLYQAAMALRAGVVADQVKGYVHYIMEDLSVPISCPLDYLKRLAARLAGPGPAPGQH
ncbi:MAG: ATP-dependent helicase [Bifidobacteriaceae bacterium]|jgi:DNA helicase-2/ATP-dependent DNA helicase PcrA|nr:ATP-dependent helicase [Bifidobacteriaceae bacterium]